MSVMHVHTSVVFGATQYNLTRVLQASRHEHRDAGAVALAARTESNDTSSEVSVLRAVRGTGNVCVVSVVCSLDGLAMLAPRR
jgi:hypothetical protein